MRCSEERAGKAEQFQQGVLQRGGREQQLVPLIQGHLDAVDETDLVDEFEPGIISHGAP